jgi:general secretion pathway protein I
MVRRPSCVPVRSATATSIRNTLEPPTAGRVTGVETNGGQAWTWTRQVSALGGSSVLRIDVAVADRTGTQLGRLTMVRPAPRMVM